jgi:hypothetical protein
VNLRRVAPIDWVVGLWGAVLIGSLWLHWYSSAPTGDVTAWQSMAVNDVILFIVGGLAVAVVFATAAQSSGAVAIGTAAFTTFGGVLAAFLALIRLIWPPDIGPGPTDRAVGLWIGAAASLATAVSAWYSLRDERRGAPGSTTVAITDLPAPRVSTEGSAE